MFVFNVARRGHEPDSARRENGLRIAHAERFQPLQQLEEFGSHLVKRQFSIEVERRLKVGEGKAGTRIVIKTGT